MATGPKKGLWVAKKVGSSPDNGGFDTYEIASGYGTALFTGDPVKLVSGKIQKAANGEDAVGVFIGCSYVDANGTPQEKAYWPASYAPPAGTQILAKVMNDPFRTFNAVGNGTVAQVQVGGIYAANLDAGSTFAGLSGLTVATVATRVGDVDIEGIADLGAAALGITDNDTLSVDTTEAGQSPTVITIVDGDGTDELLEKLNAIDNIEATLTADGFLSITATNGYSLVLANGTGTVVDDLFAGTAATTAVTVAANAGMVKVQKVVDLVNRVLEVTLVNSADRDNG